MKTAIKLMECKDDIYKLLNALSKQITTIESCLGEKCEILDLPTDIRIALDITKNGYNVLRSSIELLFQKVEIGRLESE